MNAIVGFSQLLGNGDGNENKDQYISIIQNSSDHLLRLISDIIDLSKIDAGDMEIRKSNFRLKELFIELQDIYSIELIKREKPDVKVNYLLPAGEILLQTDPFRLRQILTNLLNNAVKFTALGTITMSCEKKGKDLVFSVADTGTGIPEEDQKKIFDHFTKFNYQGMNNEGTGIGLSIVDKLVNLLNGRIWLKSVFGEGSCFYFSIPYVAPPSSFSTSNKKSEKTNRPQTQESVKSILAVEDDNTSFVLLKEFLRSLNLEIHRVTDGTDAINFIKMNPDTSLILMDIKLPFMDGYEATKAIRKINLKIPIIALTAYAMIGDKEKALSAGCNNYLSKPLDSKSLQQLVEIYLHG